MPKPILDAPRIMARIRQGVATPMSQHVDVHRKWEAGALADALDKPVDGIRCERPAALSLEYKAARVLPLQLAQGADFVAAERLASMMA
jgi:hypothetical protein